MIARQPVGQLWLAGVVPGLMMAAMFVAYIWIRCRIQPELGPVMVDAHRVPRAEKLRLLGAGLLPLGIFAAMMVPFVNGWTSLVESSAIGALAALVASILKRRMTWKVFETCTKQTLAISCMFMWIILAALGFGAVLTGWVLYAPSRTCSPNNWHEPLDDPHPDAAQLYRDGDVS